MCQQVTSVLFLTKQDELFGIGMNLLGVLGLGSNLIIDTPQKITQLCKKRVKLIGINEKNGYAVLQTGELYMWGCNYEGMFKLE